MHIVILPKPSVLGNCITNTGCRRSYARPRVTARIDRDTHTLDVSHFEQTFRPRRIIVLKAVDFPACASPAAIESKMEILAKIPVVASWVMLAAPVELFAQIGGSSPERSESLASVLDARQIADPTVAATERN